MPFATPEDSTISEIEVFASPLSVNSWNAESSMEVSFNFLLSSTLPITMFNSRKMLDNADLLAPFESIITDFGK